MTTHLNSGQSICWCTEPNQHWRCYNSRTEWNDERFAPCPIPPQKGVLQFSALLTAGPNTEQNSRFLPTALQFSFCIIFFFFLAQKLSGSSSQLISEKRLLYLKIICFIYRKERSIIMLHNIWLQFKCKENNTVQLFCTKFILLSEES